jgi:hypothetical protein
MTLDDIVARVGQSLDETRAGLGSLASCRQRAEEASGRLESPQAVLEHIDFFSGFLTRAAGLLEELRADIAGGAAHGHVEVIRQLASNAFAEQRRLVTFRDKWINRPLPYEDVRPLLSEISTIVRGQLARYRELGAVADALAPLAGPKPAADDGRALDRRALFTKWFGR